MSARIMVVETSRGFALFLATVLTKANYEVAEASDATQLKEAFAGPRPRYLRFEAAGCGKGWNCCRSLRNNGRKRR